MSVPRSRAATIFALAAASAVALAGCGILIPEPSPKTTDASGNVVDWADYPARAGMDGEARIGFPDQAELEPVARDLLARLTAAISGAGGIDLAPVERESDWFADTNWHPQEGNGYGGESMLITVNCCDFASESVPARAEWLTVVDAASRAAQAAGLGPFIIDDQSDDIVPPRPWMISATASDGVQWVFLTIEDRSLDPTGDATREAEKHGWSGAQIWLSYGATVVRAGEADAFAEAMQPFVGLEQPDATTSD